MSGISVEGEVGRNYVSKRVMVTGFVITMLWYPSIITQCFSLFMCTDYEDVSYLKNNTNLKCWKAQHLRVALPLGLFFILFWMVIYPIFITRQLKNIRHDFSS